MGYLSPSLNEKLASYHAADLRARAEVRRQRREARAVSSARAVSAVGAADAGGFDLRHWRERLAWALVGAGLSLLVPGGTPARRAAVVPTGGGRRTEQSIVTPIGCGCDGHA